MKPFFEIKSINGYARNGRMHFGDKKLETPFVLVPHDYDAFREFQRNEINTYSLSQSLIFGKYLSSNPHFIQPLYIKVSVLCPSQILLI